LTESGSETGATSTETDTGDETDDSADTSAGFYAPSSDITPVTACDPFLQGCPEGEKCVAYASTGGNWDANKCVPVFGDAGPGESCIYLELLHELVRARRSPGLRRRRRPELGRVLRRARRRGLRARRRVRGPTLSQARPTDGIMSAPPPCTPR